MCLTDEVLILKIISTSDPSHPGCSHTITLFDHFSLQFMHGEHMGLAFKDVLGQSVCDLRRRTPTCTLSLEIVRRVLKQVLLALDYVHDCCKIIHTGMYLLISMDLSITELLPDLKPDSILVCFNDPQYIIRHLPGNSPSISPRHKSSRDGQGVPIDPIPTPSDMLEDASLHVKLIDFGHGTLLLFSDFILIHM